MASNELPIAVVGAGAVGSIIIGRLIDSGYEDIAVVDIPERIDQICEHGIGLSKLALVSRFDAALGRNPTNVRGRPGNAHCGAR